MLEHRLRLRPTASAAIRAPATTGYTASAA